jgi:hypothetical protein
MKHKFFKADSCVYVGSSIVGERRESRTCEQDPTWAAALRTKVVRQLRITVTEKPVDFYATNPPTTISTDSQHGSSTKVSGRNITDETVRKIQPFHMELQRTTCVTLAKDASATISSVDDEDVRFVVQSTKLRSSRHQVPSLFNNDGSR